jgi:transposase, IS5 family
MKRREFIAGLGGTAAWPMATPAQQGNRIRRIGVANAKSALDTNKDSHGEIVTDTMQIDAIREEIAYYCGLEAQVIDQARRRVLDGEQVPNEEKIFSIFETHTDLLKRGKVRTPVEFGHKVFLAESAIGLITQYEVLK